MNDALSSALADEALRIEEDTLFSSRGHFETARRWSKAHYWIGIPTSVLAALAGVSAIADMLPVAAVIAILVTALSALSTFLNPSKRANQHHFVGTRFNEVRNQARIFREIGLRGNSEAAALTADLRKLAAARDELNKSSPQIPRWAFERARAGILAGEASFAVDQAKAESS